MCPLGPARRPKRKRSSCPKNLVGPGRHIESAVLVCERGEAHEEAAANTYVLQRSRRSFTEKVHVSEYRAKKINIIVGYLYQKNRCYRDSPRCFPAFTWRVPNRNHAERRILRVIALHERT
jgi:hypothetical protein